MVFRHFFFFLYLATSSSLLCCQENLPCSLRLDVLIQSVIENNPNLDATRLRILAAHEAVHRVQVLDDPQFMVISDWNKFHTTSEFTPMMSYGLSQTIPFPGKLRLKGEIAKAVMLKKQSEEITTYRELIRQTKIYYYQLYNNFVSLKINHENIELINSLIEDNMALYRSGKGKYVDIVKMQLELQILEEQRFMLEAETTMLQSMINALLNQPPTTPLGEPIAFFTPKIHLTFHQAEAIALSTRSELQGMEAMIKEQHKMAALARRNYYPDFTVGVAYERMNSRFNGHVDNALMVSLGFNLPIYIPEKQAREVREAQANANAIQRELEGMSAMISGRLKELLAKLKSIDDRIALYQEGVFPKVREAFAALLSSYRSGEGDLLILLDTWRQAFNAELEYQRFLTEREIAIAELERALGLNVEEFLCGCSAR